MNTAEVNDIYERHIKPRIGSLADPKSDGVLLFYFHGDTDECTMIQDQVSGLNIGMIVPALVEMIGLEALVKIATQVPFDVDDARAKAKETLGESDDWVPQELSVE